MVSECKQWQTENIYFCNYHAYFLKKTFLPNVHFINVLRAHFSYKSLFGSFFLVTFCRKKHFCTKKNARKMLTKFTPNVSRIWASKIGYGRLVLSSRQFLLLPQLPQKMKLALKVVKSDSMIITLLQSKSVTISAFGFFKI